jgi:hypothetical protein
MSDEDTEVPPSTDPVEIEDVQPDLFEVSVKGAGVALTRTVDQPTALSVIAIVLGGGAAPPVPAHVSHASPAPLVNRQRDPGPSTVAGGDSLDPNTTIGEYLDECESRQFPAKITAIGNFLELRLGQSSFTRDEIKSQFRPAGETQPANYSRDFNDAITQRWIAEDPNEKGQYFVTKTGKAAIAARFDRSIRRAAPTRRKKPTAKSNNGADSTSAENTNLTDLDDE